MNPKDIPDHIFRGYDLRGVCGVDLNEEILELLGKGYATYLAQRRIKDCVVGMDNRLTSETYKNAFIKGLRSCGINVIDFNLGLAQIMYFAQYLYRTKGGAFITASHNPANYNGMKLAVGFSQTMIFEEIQELKTITKSGDYALSNKEGTYKSVDIFQTYVEDIISRVQVGKKFKIVVDASNTASGLFMPQIFRKVGCEVIEQNCNLDGNFPNGTPDPTEVKIQERLAKRVVEEKADLGFSYDADGDRIGVVDEKGNLIWNDTLVSIFAIDVLDYLPGSKIIFNTLCSKQVAEVIKIHKGIPIIWRTGHSFIKEKVAEERSPFGGELSGHFFFVDNFYGHDDGAFSSLRLLSYLERVSKPLSEVVSELPKYISSPEIKVGCTDDSVKVRIVKNIAKIFKADFPNAQITDDSIIPGDDGVRADFDDGMIIFRYSQNGPYITVKFEAKDEKTFEERRKYVHQLLKRFPEMIWEGSNSVNLDFVK